MSLSRAVNNLQSVIFPKKYTKMFCQKQIDSFALYHMVQTSERCAKTHVYILEIKIDQASIQQSCFQVQ